MEEEVVLCIVMRKKVVQKEEETEYANGVGVARVEGLPCAKVPEPRKCGSLAKM